VLPKCVLSITSVSLIIPTNFESSTIDSPLLPVVTINYVDFLMLSIGFNTGVFTTKFFNFDEGLALTLRKSSANIIPKYF
jgi:hypothetical protein